MKPFNLSLYRLALCHTSMSRIVSHTGFKESNERLEYLGDALLGAVIADYLFRKYPFKNEGFLTEIRSRIVNRESLNGLSQKIGLDELIQYEGNNRGKTAYKSLNGDALEALVGAIYLDKGFRACARFIIHRLIRNHLDLEEIVANNKNFKSIVIEWAQKENRELRFEIIKEVGSKHQREFVAQIFVDDEPLATGSGYSKKKAEQAAAQKSCEVLNLTA
ncbi:MAG: ribonuclease III [Microscillaceae bacterium]|nr:ribonuclease III [Microscillaceae bacterium]